MRPAVLEIHSLSWNYLEVVPLVRCDALIKARQETIRDHLWRPQKRML